MKCEMIMLLIACGSLALLGHVCETRQVILNEDTLTGTCTKSCEEITFVEPEDDKTNCKTIRSCTKSSSGWTKGFVRCDYCKCDCEVSDAEKDVSVKRSTIRITEPDLLGTCTKTCDNRGLVRTNHHGCQEIRDCSRADKGWTRGWVRCDYCKCTCINRKYATEYRLENVMYDYSKADLKALSSGKHRVAQATVKNRGSNEQVVTRSLSYTVSESTTMEMSHSVEVGLSVTVTASGGVPGLVEVGASATNSITAGFTYTSGSAKTETNTETVEAELTVPGKHSMKANIMATELQTDIPYKATLVTVYEDKSESKKSITGTLTDVHTSKAEVEFTDPVPL